MDDILKDREVNKYGAVFYGPNLRWHWDEELRLFFHRHFDEDYDPVMAVFIQANENTDACDFCSERIPEDVLMLRLT